MRRYVWALAGVVVLAAVITAEGDEISFTVEEPLGAAREAEIASGGIPFPIGACRDPAGFSLYDGDREVPVQVSPIVTYPDGSLHWALVSFPVSLSGNAAKTFVLKDAPGTAALADPVVVRESGDTIEVSNGIVAFAVNRKAFNGFKWVSYKGSKIFTAATAGLTAGGEGAPCAPILFEFPHRGPVITTLHVKGTYGSSKAPTYSMRISLRAGEPRIHMEHNLRNGGLGAKKKMQASDPQLRLGLEGSLDAAGGGAGEKKGRRGPAYAWKTFSGAADLLVFTRHGGRVDRNVTMTCEAASEGGEFVIDMAFGKGTPVLLDEGCHKLTEIDLCFGTTFSPEALAAPLHARAACSRYADHDGLGAGLGFGSREDEAHTYRNAGWTNIDDPKKAPVRAPNPTMYAGSIGVHDTSECDQILGLTLGYVRSGQRGYLDEANAWARFWQTRYMYRTDEFTYGKEGRQGKPAKFGGDRTCASGCHTYGVGIFSLALITGNVDMLEAAFELAEQANGTWGTHSGKKPGDQLSFFGCRGFVRSGHAVYRAYDVARTPEWEERAVHFVRMAAQAMDRDPRGFLWHGGVRKKSGKHIESRYGRNVFSPRIKALYEKEGTIVHESGLEHPTYGTWNLSFVSSWTMAMHVMALNDAHRALAASANPEAQLAAEDARDMAIAYSQFGAHWMWHPLQKAIPYKMHLDFPIPGYLPNWKGDEWDEYKPKGTNSWYTKWWPGPIAVGYRLTGDRKLFDLMQEVLWWGLSRTHTNPPAVARGEAPPFADISTNTKGDEISPTALAFGVGAHPRKDTAAPAAITDLAATRVGGSTIELTWTAPKDEGGTVAFYQVKWGEKPLADYPVDGEQWRKNWGTNGPAVTYWNTAVNVLGEPAPQSAGSKETMTLEVPGGKPIHVAVRSFDDSHNRSAVSNVAAVAKGGN